MLADTAAAGARAHRGGPTLTGAIVMSTYGRARRAAAAVERLLALSEGWHVIVVDDASPDETTPLLRERFEDRIEVIRLDDNRGSAARNVGVEAAGTDLVAFCDDDSWWAPGALDAASRVFTEGRDVGLVAASVCVEPGRVADPVNEQLATSPLPATPWGPSVLGFLACAAVVRRRAFLDAGGFHPLLHIGGEEEMLALDLRAAGWQVVHVADAVAHHEPAAGDAGRQDRAARLVRNQLWVRLMRRSPWVAAAATAATIARSPRSSASRRACVETVAQLPALVRHRRPVPAAVESAARSLERPARGARRRDGS